MHTLLFHKEPKSQVRHNEIRRQQRLEDMANAPYDPRRPERQATLQAIAAGDMDRVYLSLSPRQRAFCEEYVVDFSGKNACIRAGYSTKWADRQAALNLKHKGVSAYINHLQTSKEAKLVSVDPDYIIAQITSIIGKPGAKDSDKLRGLELLARHLGMFVERQEITTFDVNQQKVEEEAQSFTNLLRQLSERRRSEPKLKAPVENVKGDG